MTITIKDIANKAGLSPASVSRILTNRGRFNAETAQKVRDLAESMGYFKNQSAADLSQKESRVIGVLVPSSHTNFADEIIKGMQSKAYELNYELIVAFVESDIQQQIQTVKSLLSRNLLAIAMLAIDIDDTVLAVLLDTNVQLISVSNQLNNKIPSISSNNYDTVHDIVDYLYDNGHRDIALIGSSRPEPIVANLRRQGFINALSEHGITYNPDFIWGVENTYQTGLDAIKHFGVPLPFSAAIGSADIISIGLLNGAKDAQLSIPEDLSIVTIDGTDLTQLTRPILTSTKQNFQLMGQLAITSLAEKKLSPHTIIFTDTTLVLGGTVASPLQRGKEN
ncbi:LacI family DNA-binding transcriptional regulator [Leuconostoc gelidum subsp. gelidum]|uniref:LacI family DNA-binding transcriptional regulator n=1 Tax=Leuconostoc gelidum subsp. gelidum TaxID=1607839 RepID=A0AB35G0J1_LEUGE|nr:LacI family DNA-binding transcriptional regulator [Leuconostoc gelidum]MBZ5963717.1 LacI family DNA-binding transcriptional regulator [Leuconostoc gelidum subsp. gelidum]MBZ5975440.1 LacI family DNA-binding transcriptional regulator [Leuconostoc gelidum subsp. gelidum]MBZ5976389.1 LacI family DNA-binding transcriptional regulator [Leuconostoc gelidum subsp. gelidum]MBZ5978479.1 LacI family DNA-binding transcriptional regulator [Leuconostoc gelidum subsp. gelidum]MBZ5987174.1 LacI family DNA